MVLRVDVEEELSSKECPRPRIGNGGHGELFVMQEVMISKDFSYLWSGSWESAGFVLLRFLEICNFFFSNYKTQLETGLWIKKIKCLTSTYSNRSHNTQISARMVGLFLHSDKKKEWWACSIRKKLGWIGGKIHSKCFSFTKTRPIYFPCYSPVQSSRCHHFSSSYSSRNNGRSRNVDFEKSEGDNTFRPKQPDRKAGIQLRNHYCIVNLDPFKSNRDTPAVFVGL